ncbi:MAG: hypothetical protein JW706_01215 [Opitutales bacterium]|nr:hypothetical protein [Opitutales bacterium]
MDINSATIKASYHKYPLAWWSGILAVVLGLILYFRMPVMQQTEDALALIQDDLDTIQINFREGSGMKEDLDHIEELVKNLGSRLTDADQRARNIGYFDGFPSLHSERLKSIQLSGINQMQVISEAAKPTDGDIWAMKHYAVLPFEMTVSGLLTEILEMMYLLKQSDVILNFRSFDLTTDSRREQGYMSMRLVVNTVAKPVTSK